MGITSNVAAFDQWIRSSFVELNNELEGVYWGQDNKADVSTGGGAIKQQLLEEGRSHITLLLGEGNTDEGFDNNFDLLVNRFIEKQAQALPEKFQENITASGPPFEVVVGALAKLHDLPLAANRDDIPSQYADIEKLKLQLK